MPQHEYSAADITVLEFAEGVRRRPGMFFGIGPDNPAMPTKILDCALGSALHPATSLAAVHAPIVRADIIVDLAFTVTDDQAAATAARASPSASIRRCSPLARPSPPTRPPATSTAPAAPAKPPSTSSFVIFAELSVCPDALSSSDFSD